MYKKISLFLDRNKGIVIILCLGMIFRLIYFLIILHNFGSAGFYLTANGDAVEYLSMARQWLEYGTYHNSQLNEPEIFRMPGYPLFIAFFYKIFSDVSLAILAQNLIFLACAALFYKFTLGLFKSKKVALFCAGLLSLEPSIIYWNSQLITETLFAGLIFLCVYTAFVFYKKKSFYYPALTGLLLSLAIFIRPAGEYLAATFIIFYIVILLFRIITFKKFILSVLIFIIAFLLPLFPWMAGNYGYFGYFAVSNSSIVGFGKYLTAIGEQTGEDFKVSATKNSLKDVAMVRQRALEIIAEHPLVFLKIYGLSLAPFFFGDGYLSVFGRIFPELEKQRVITNWKGDGRELLGFVYGHRGAEAITFFFGKLVWSLMALLALAGIVRWVFKYKKEYPILILMSLIIFYFSLASGVGSYSRFRFPVIFFIFLFSSIGVSWFLDFIKSRRPLLKSNDSN